MASSTTSRAVAANSYEQFAGTSAILAGVGGVLYSIAFVFLKQDAFRAGLTGAFLILGGLLTVSVLLGLYQCVRDTDPSFALLGLLLGAAGAFGTTVHGAYDLANALHPPTIDLDTANVPSSIDPRGLMTFGVTGLALLVFSLLIRRGGSLPVGLGNLGLVLAILLIVIYLVRLIYFTPTTPVLIAAGLTGIIVNPTWLIWLGATLRRGRAS